MKPIFSAIFLLFCLFGAVCAHGHVPQDFARGQAPFTLAYGNTGVEPADASVEMDL